MAHRGQRSTLARQERTAKRFIYEHAFIDRKAGEIICMVQRVDVLGYLAEVFEDPQPCSIPEILRGLVLADGYGSGAFQNER
jgi:hypothetical protein